MQELTTAKPASRRFSALCILILIVTIGLCRQCVAQGGPFADVLVFGQGNQGLLPKAGLILGADGYFYGTTYAGGVHGYGNVYKVSADGSVFTVLHSFNGWDGADPSAALIQATDGYFYGTTQYGGLGNVGTVFKISSDGSTFTSLHSFSGLDGSYPEAALMQGSDGFLYGTTYSDGVPSGTNYFSYGTVFKVSSDGSVFSTIHSFVANDGFGPEGKLVQGPDGALYGTTSGGGTTGIGTVFKMSTDGVTITTLCTFAPTYLGGQHTGPHAGVVFGTDGLLYGTAFGGGPDSFGLVFKVSTDGNTFAILHTFDTFFGATDGGDPQAGLVLGTDGYFYGTTSVGGTHGCGTIFRASSFGGYSTVHSFAASEGNASAGTLVYGSNGHFFGTTYQGGTEGFGAAFEASADGNFFSTHHSFTGFNGTGLIGGLIEGVDGDLYGTTTGDLASRELTPIGYGTIFKTVKNGAEVTNLRSLAPPDGTDPWSRLMLGSDGYIYGTASANGAYGYGTVFKVSSDGATFTTLHSFNNTDGNSPVAGLMQGTDGYLYGTTAGGGASSSGTVFKMSTDGVTFATLHSFSGTDGSAPYTGLVQADDGYLYGTTASGGLTNVGTAFKISTDGVTFLSLRSFSRPDGFGPESDLIQGRDGYLYGTTAAGGINGRYGTVFKMSTDGTVYVTLHAFTHYDGDGSQGAIVQGNDSYIYGVTQGGGIYGGYGTAFKVSPDGGDFTMLHSFSYADGFRPFGGLLMASDGSFYGTTLDGGAGMGVIFKLPVPLPPGNLIAAARSGKVDLTWSASASATSYSVFEGTTAGGEAATPVATAVSGTSVAITGLTNGTTYYFTVAAVNANSQSFSSNEAVATPLFIPPTPTGLSATPGNARVILAWTGSTVATSYSIYRGTTSYGQAVTPYRSGLTSTTFTDVGVTNGVTYFYRVAAFNANGNSPEGNQASATPVAPPAVPTNLTAAPGNAKITLSWTAGAGATSYSIYRGTTSYGQAVAPFATGITGTTYVNTGLTIGTTYYYRIAAFNPGGNSPEGNQAQATPVAPPPVPTHLTPVPGNARITLSWTASPGATSYNIYRGTTSYGQSATPVASGITGTTYVNTGLTNGTTYYYRAAAFNAGGNSPAGNQAQAAPVAPPPVPTNLTALPGNAKVTLSWSASPGATSYNVYRGTTSYGEAVAPYATGIKSMAYTDTGVANGTTYYYRVAAFNAGGNSPEGNQAQATPVAPPVPTASSVSPNAIPAGSTNTAITVTGSGFQLNSVARWNGAALSTTYVSPTKLTATVPAAYLVKPVSTQITVSTPAPGGGTSAGVPITVTP